MGHCDIELFHEVGKHNEDVPTTHKKQHFVQMQHLLHESEHSEQHVVHPPWQKHIQPHTNFLNKDYVLTERQVFSKIWETNGHGHVDQTFARQENLLKDFVDEQRTNRQKWHRHNDSVNHDLS